jgi:hypothetical protein
MREREALEYLDRTLPRDVGFTLNRVSWSSAVMEFGKSRPVRARPASYQTAREWGVSISYSGPQGDYLDVSMQRSLSRAVKDAVAKFLAWRLNHTGRYAAKGSAA